MNWTSIIFDESLPINQKRQEISDLIAKNRVVVIAGETGSGKTTQIPKMCLTMGFSESGIIGHTQPRRIAARTVANRIAEELKTPLGTTVGYKIRFSDKTQTDTAIKVMTDGILLAEIKSDPLLKKYSVLIIDEAHERSLNIDLILGYLKQILFKRSDLKIIITSATIDPEKFSKFFKNAPIVEVSGRTYPVDVWYRPLVGEGDEKSLHQVEGILQAVDEVSKVGRGDILIFLSGEREIRETAEALQKHHLFETEILPLYARLNATQQHKVFEPGVGRRIILTTNVAETSLTVPGIQFVIDTGVARVSRYNYRNQVQRLPIEAISKASANQRKGRCGRVMAGICVRLFAEEDFQVRPDFTEPEILRTSLAGVILHMLVVGLGDVEAFPFLDPPDIRQVREGFRCLEQLGAVTAERTLTPLGVNLSQFPIDPVLGTIILMATKQGCLTEILIIASALSIQDPRERPAEWQAAADEKHSRFKDPRSDFLAFLKLWEIIHKEREQLSNNQFKTWCRNEFLSFVRIQDWRDIHQQLNALVTEMGYRVNESPGSYEGIHCALLAGLISNIGAYTEKNIYMGLRNTKFSIFPGSVLFSKPPKWLLAFEIVETKRLYARIAARILPEWVETIAGHLLKIHYDAPHWERKAKQVIALAKANLYGIIIYEGRKIVYGRIDPILSREIFIRSALVEGEYDTKAQFFKHNRELIGSIETLEHKTRRRDILVDEQELYEFYDKRIPEEIVSGPEFEQWLKTIDQTTLLLTESALVRRDAVTEMITFENYPETVLMNNLKLPLAYHFEPGKTNDGMTVTIPILAIKQLTETPFEWLVPGLLKEKIAALIKSLPKHLRRHFVPVPEYAEAVFNRLISTFRIGSLKERMAKEMVQISGVVVKRGDFSDDLLPLHLKMNYKAINSDGQIVSTARQLNSLQEIADEHVQVTAKVINQGLTNWPLEPLPTQVDLKQQGLVIPGYPALVDQGESVAIQIMTSQDEALVTHRQGVLRLLYLAEIVRLKYIIKQLSNLTTLALQFYPLGTKEQLIDDFLMATIDKSFLTNVDWEGIELPRTDTQFKECLDFGKPKLILIANELSAILTQILMNYQKVKALVTELNASQKEQLEYLVYLGFLKETPIEWLRRIPVYLQALEYRILKSYGAKTKDDLLEKQIKPFWQRYIKAIGVAKKECKNLEDWLLYRWMLEEFRVSLFAQHLKTIMPISAKRLETQWKKIGNR